MKCINELRSDDPDHAAVPAFASHDDHRARSHLEIGLDQLARLRDDVGLFLLPPEILGVELLGQLARFISHAVVRCQQESCGDVGRAHAAGRVHTGRQHEADVIAVDLLARETADFEQGAQTRSCAAPWTACRDQASR